ncbi:type 4a pilus biogenesis protein PilO [soil metagenome]
MNIRQYTSQFDNLNMRDVGTWPPVPKIAALLFMLIVILIAGWFFYWSTLLDELNAAQQEEIALKSEYKGKLQQAINLDALLKQREQVKQYVLALEKQLPSKAEMDALLSDINQAGLGRGLTFELFKPGQIAPRDYYAELPINVRVVGNYHDIGTFTSDIANLPRIVTLNNLEIKSDEKTNRLSLDAIAKTFRYLDAEEVAAQKRAMAEKKKAAGK